MTNDQISQVFEEANKISHTAALRAVFEAGFAAATAPLEPAGIPAEEDEPDKSFDDMTNAELRDYLTANEVTHHASDDKATLMRLARAKARKLKASA